MPIRAELRHLYSRAAGWPEIRAAIRERAGDRCECSGECGSYHAGGRCGVPHLAWIARPLTRPYEWAVVAKGAKIEGATVLRAVLGVAHLDHNPEHNDPANLRLLCQRCHLNHDRQRHQATRAHLAWQAERAAGQRDLVLDVLGAPQGVLTLTEVA